jgi:predicted MFS family arabinose efflux permease
MLRGVPGPLWAAIYVGVAAATLPAVLPVMVGVMADQLGFGVERAGYVASANMAGIALGSIAGAILTRRWSWTAVIIAGLIVMIGANGLTILGTTFSYVAAMRFASGFGEGLIAGICYAAMGRSGQAARALAFYVAGQGLVGAVGMGFMTAAIQQAGWKILFILVSILAVPAFWLARSIGSLDVRGSTVKEGDKRDAMTWLGWSAVFALLAQFVGLSSIWAFLERLGHTKEIDAFHLSLALSASAIANMMGSLAVGLLAHRIRGLLGVALAFALFMVSIAAAFMSNDWRVYLIAGVLFMLSWAIYFPFQFGLLAAFDRGGSLAAIMPAVTGLGFTIGPALGGIFLARGGTGAILCLGFACRSARLPAWVCIASQGDWHDMANWRQGHRCHFWKHRAAAHSSRKWSHQDTLCAATIQCGRRLRRSERCLRTPRFFRLSCPYLRQYAQRERGRWLGPCAAGDDCHLRGAGRSKNVDGRNHDGT